MARWIVNRRSDGHLELDYLRRDLPDVFKAGEMHASTCLDDIVRWIVEARATRPGDIILLPDGNEALQVLPLVRGSH